jgi:hypothetical protein
MLARKFENDICANSCSNTLNREAKMMRRLTAFFAASWYCSLARLGKEFRHNPLEYRSSSSYSNFRENSMTTLSFE